MKQLLYSFDGENGASYVVVALADRVLVGSSLSAAVVELVAPSFPLENPSEIARRISHPEDGDIPPLHVQAVAGCWVKSTKSTDDCDDDSVHIYCGVARQNKSLSVYRLPCSSFLPTNSSMTLAETLTLHQTPKRVSSMVFTTVPGARPPLTVVITGDLAGDSFAYSLTQGSTDCTAKEAPDEGHSPHRRLLLGHTASMLTSVTAAAEPASDRVYLLTADRDEKIRVTAFPKTYEIHGFLLGHEAFVSCMTVLGNQCFSCGGDRTLRVWDFLACRQKACFDLQRDLTSFQPSGVPCEMSVGRGKDGSLHIAVIYDESPHLDIFQLVWEKDTCRIQQVRQLTLPGQPLGLSAPCGKSIVALIQQPSYLKCFDWDGSELSLPPALQVIREQASNDSITMPVGVLERDKDGNLKMIKNSENRGPATSLPWNDYNRKEKASKKRSRSTQRRNEKHHKAMANANGGTDGSEELESNVADEDNAAEDTKL